MTLDAALGAPDPLPGDPPEETLALVAVGGGGGGPEDEVVGRRAGDWVDQGLQGLLEHVHLQLLVVERGSGKRGEAGLGLPGLESLEQEDGDLSRAFIKTNFINPEN